MSNVNASALIKVTSPAGSMGPSIYRVVLDGSDHEDLNNKIDAYITSLTPQYTDLHGVKPDIEWELICDGSCIGIGCIKNTL